MILTLFYSISKCFPQSMFTYQKVNEFHHFVLTMENLLIHEVFNGTLFLTSLTGSRFKLLSFQINCHLGITIYKRISSGPLFLLLFNYCELALILRNQFSHWQLWKLNQRQSDKKWNIKKAIREKISSKHVKSVTFLFPDTFFWHKMYNF